jgi:hypothetical protein
LLHRGEGRERGRRERERGGEQGEGGLLQEKWERDGERKTRERPADKESVFFFNIRGKNETLSLSLSLSLSLLSPSLSLSLSLG